MWQCKLIKGAAVLSGVLLILSDVDILSSHSYCIPIEGYQLRKGLQEWKGKRGVKNDNFFLPWGIL